MRRVVSVAPLGFTRGGDFVQHFCVPSRGILDLGLRLGIGGIARGGPRARDLGAGLRGAGAGGELADAGCSRDSILQYS